MKGYTKPKIEIKGYKSSENFADLWSDVFGTGTDIPVSVYTLADDTSAA